MTAIRVCAHMNLGPFTNVHIRCDSIGEAVSEFRSALEQWYGYIDKGIVERTGEDYRPTLDLYPRCRNCNSQENYHDYPMSRYQIGNRGGIRKVTV